MLPLLYSFTGLWVALGFSDKELSDAAWYIKDEHMTKTYFIFFVASVFFYLGSVVTLNKKKSGNFNISEIRDELFKLGDGSILVFYFAAVIFFHIAYPFEYIYFRKGYLPIYEGSNFLKLIFDFSVILLLLVLPFYKSKFVRIFLFIIILTLVQGLNKRIIVLLPLLYFLGSYLRDYRFYFLKFFVLVSISVFFSAVAYEYRGNLAQGVIPNIVFFYNSGLDFEKSLSGVNYLFGFSFFSTLITYNFFDVSISDFLISINPLPSTIVDVSTVVEKHKITAVAPYSALGTLGVLGFTYVSLYYFSAGFIFGFCKNYFPVRFSLASSFIFLFFVLFAVTTLQYQLRSATRLVYYTMLCFLVFKIISSSFANKKRSN